MSLRSEIELVSQGAIEFSVWDKMIEIDSISPL